MAAYYISHPERADASFKCEHSICGMKHLRRPHTNQPYLLQGKYCFSWFSFQLLFASPNYNTRARHENFYSYIKVMRMKEQ